MEIEKALKRLLIKNPFYGLFCLSLPKVITTSVSTLCVSRKGINCQLNINPDFWNKHTVDEQLALLQHELSHIAFQHMFMVESFKNPKLFNISADAEVNSYIENLPKGAVTADLISKKINKLINKGIGTKEYYKIIQDFLNQQQQKAQAQNPQKPCNGGMGGNSTPQDNTQDKKEDTQQTPQSSSPSQATSNEEGEETDSQTNSPSLPSSQQKSQPQENNSTDSNNEQQERGEDEEEESQYPEGLGDELSELDDHSTWKSFKDMPEATQQLVQNNINSIIKQTAEQVKKMHGTIPGEFEEIIEKLNKKMPEVFNWKAYFRRMLGSIYDVNIRSTRRKISKRFEGAAGVQHKKKVSILVAIDTSASVSTNELKEFLSEIDYVFRAGARVTIIQCDTRINSIEEYDGKNTPTIKGRGGTSFDPPVNYYVKNKKEYASLIYFTDGEAPMPYKRPRGMVWVISSNGNHNYDYPGKTIFIPKNTNNEQ